MVRDISRTECSRTAAKKKGKKKGIKIYILTSYLNSEKIYIFGRTLNIAKVRINS